MRGQKRNETFVLKHRLTGAAILIGFAVIILPMLLGNPDGGDDDPDDSGVRGTSENHVFQSKIQPIGGQIPEGRAVSSSGGGTAGETERPATPPPSGGDGEQTVVTAEEGDASGAEQQVAREEDRKSGREEQSESGEAGDVERGWIVQVGTFKNPDNVEKLVIKLKNNGFAPSETEVKTGEGVATRVWVGPFRTRVEAARNKTRVKQRTGSEGLIVAYP